MFTQRTHCLDFSQHGNMRAVSQDMGNKVTGATVLKKKPSHGLFLPILLSETELVKLLEEWLASLELLVYRFKFLLTLVQRHSFTQRMAFKRLFIVFWNSVLQ